MFSGKSSLLGWLAVAFGATLTLSCATADRDVDLNTWTVIAVDPSTGDTGIAGASCVPTTHIDAIALLAPGKGAAVVQGLWSLENRNRVFEFLKDGQTAEDIIRNARSLGDRSPGMRQYAAVTLRNGKVEAAAFTGPDTQPWSGSRQDSRMAVSVQGNVLEREAVVEDALAAFKANRPNGQNTIPDRLIRALEAGSAAGGDRRCNNAETKQTAASAFILFARAKESAYTTREFGITDAGTSRAPGLALSVTTPRFGANPLPELRKRYDEWRSQNR
jgi:uncharacterized Ntn-hydrolase superfamily protein